MAAWIPLLKASLPYLTQIVTTAIPAFTAKTPNTKPDELLPKQISELQVAVTSNAESVKALATQLRETIESIESGSAGLQRELALIKRFAIASLIFAVMSLTFGLWTILHKG